jgi:hypothetical protein
MRPPPVHRLPASLESAVQRLKMAARNAAERSVESLGLAALASTSTNQRDSLLEAQFELNRKSAIFALTFNEAFDEAVLRDCAPRTDAGGHSSWDALSLVDDQEVERQVAAERLALEIAHGCEWELRELDAFVGSVLGIGHAEQDRNPLRPQVIGQALLRGVEALSDRPDVRRLLGTELGRSFSALLRGTYQDIIAEMRSAGVKPAGLSVRQTDARDSSRGASGFDALGRQHGGDDGRGGQGHPSRSGMDSRYGGGRQSSSGAFGPSTRSGPVGGGTAIGQVDPAMMSLIRRLAFATPVHDSAAWDDGGLDDGGGYAAPAPPNLIRAHRSELRQAANGKLDHMVIDVIGSLFDQILSDPKVPPQMARQIGRLQLPVLRAALGDPSFFSSRRHPVRRFVNRIASLGAAFEDFSEEAAQSVLAKVRELVQQIVEGDFDQIEVYESKLAALEGFIAEQGQREVDAHGQAAEMLAQKEDELRLRALYAQQLEGDLKGLAAPPFVRDFVAKVWSQVLIKAAELDGPDGERPTRLRGVGRELFMSVQPKTSPAQRKVFLAELPALMKELTAGLNLIGWPEASRREFFGQLLPAHAASLKAESVRVLDFNMLSRQVEGALAKPLPSGAALKVAAADLPVLSEEIILPRFSAEEAQRIGLMTEAAVDWDGKVDIDVGDEPDAASASHGVAGLPEASEPLEPTHGKSLADHVQIGFAYQMHLEGDWQKVRLTHVSPGRTFFVFTHGKKQRKTVSLTHRMLVRMCESNRLRAFESAYLLERATARARRQLSGLGAAA